MLAVAALDDRVAVGEGGALPAAADIALLGAVGAALVAALVEWAAGGERETRWAVEA